ncbi:MAG: PH domain-containing protein [Gemmatimonadota bacterium]|nr:MAG: PH domain-containing protein [Gemmatimonadota bacterium]
MDEFDAPQDRFVQTVTVLIIITFVVLILIFASTGNNRGLGATTVIGLLVLVTSYLFAPHGYAIDESEVLIRRKIGSVKIPIKRIESLRYDPAACSLWGVRTFGVSGLFGYFGRFYTHDLGHHIRYATDRDKAIVIEADKTFVISPDDPAQFIQIVKARMEANR